jgi:diketogulonate reductase-like aldo/keto reductase
MTEGALPKPATREVQGIQVPVFLYGTAWKEAETAKNVTRALKAGFRGIDTANQRKHYFEAQVGEAIKAAQDAGALKRDDLFLQTKFTYQRGQDSRLPYDPKADLTTQVQQSFQSSLEHLVTERIDSFVLHGPSQHPGLGAADLEVWRAMEGLHDAGKVKLLGVSNVTAQQLEQLWSGARVKPAMVQNRCYATDGWDRGVRAVCKARGIVYQGFSLLTANQQALQHPDFLAVCSRARATSAQGAFALAMKLGMICLTGTTDKRHMAEDLAAVDVTLADDDVKRLERLFG